MPIVSSDDNNRVQISTLAGDETDQYFCTGIEDGSVLIFEMETAKQHRKLYTHSSSVAVIEMAWSKKQKYFASADESGHLITKELEKPANQRAKWKVFPLLDFRLSTTVTQLLFSSSEEFLLVSSGPLDHVYSTKTKQKLFQVARHNESSRQWVQHPTDTRLLIGVECQEQALYEWSNVEKVHNNRPVPGAGDLSIEQPFKVPLAGVAPGITETLNKLEHVFLLQDRYMILEFLPNHSFSPGTHPTASRYLEIIDLDDATYSHGLQRRNLPLLGEAVNRLVGVTQEHLVFLDHQYWVCTWALDRGDNGEYTKHFFLPKDWLSPGALSLITINQYGTLLCPKNGEVAIVKEGIRI